MIRLTLHTPSHSEIRLFDKPVLLLGSDISADIQLRGVEIQPFHLSLIDQHGSLILINLANDATLLVNGLSIEKKLLSPGDLVTLGSYTLLFEHLVLATGSSAVQPESPPPRQDPIFSFPQRTPTAPGQESSVREEAHRVEASKASEREPKSRGSLKDDYLKEFEDEMQGSHFDYSGEPSHLYQAWKKILLFIASLLAISGFVGAVIYFTVSDKTEVQEAKATRGVADIAAALTHARLNQLKPNNHNWADADFLKSNLQAILPDVPSYASKIDAQGQFHCCPYNLRIYTSDELSRFLLIAQPTPNFSYWLVPHSLIVVDSHTMELRKLKEVRSLNRLLTHSDPLEGVNGREISNLVKQGQLIPLSELAEGPNATEFTTPSPLASVKPGAENCIYNAPRYYRLGQHLVQEGVRVSASRSANQEAANLKQCLDSTIQLHPLILYATSKAAALLARQGISLLAPSDKLLFGYLSFSPHGTIDEAHLILDEESDQESSLSGEQEDACSQIDRTHPFYVQLRAPADARIEALKPLVLAMTLLLNRELHAPQPNGESSFQNLANTYWQTDLAHRRQIRITLETLKPQDGEMSTDQLQATIRELRLEALLTAPKGS